MWDFLNCANPKGEEKVFVSAACGSIGSLVGQYVKLFDRYVVGCVGSQNKLRSTLINTFVSNLHWVYR
ncbi:hypothetical protein HN51_054633 [Arachis hypogaea]